MDIDEIVQGKLDADTDFQASLADLSDEEKNTAISAKRSELTKVEYKSVSEEKAKQEKIAADQKTRAEKAETELKKLKPEEKAEVEKDLSTVDLYALTEAKVPLEDVEEVKKASKLLGKSIPDTLKDETVQGILKTRQEHRASAAAANINGGRPGPKKQSDAEILDKASKGDIPDKGSAEAEQLFYARRGGRR